MLPILLTKYQGAFLGPIANLLGILMNGIFNLLDLIKIPNTGLSIILFTIAVNCCMLPLTMKQQKFSKLQAKMNPELQVVQAKYKGKKDNESMQLMNTETQAIYAKYGVSPTGSCIQLLIQMPILFALYRVINNMPAYVVKIKEAFFPLVENLIKQTGSAEFLQTFKGFGTAVTLNSNYESESFLKATSDYTDTFVDILNKASSSEFLSIAEKYPALKEDVSRTIELLGSYNNFLGINIGDSPSFMVSEAWNAAGGVAWLTLIAALIIPVLSAATQWINVKLMPQQAQTAGDQSNSIASSMKTMNTMMPLMSAFFCYSLPAGMGLYWIASSVVRSVQQVLINKHIDKIDLDELIRKNVEKRNKKLEKQGIDPKKINTYANLSTKKTITPASGAATADKAEALRKANEYYNKNTKSGSIASKANMVKQFNEKNNK